MATTALSIIANVEEAPSRPVIWEGEHSHFIKQCAVMVQKWKDRVLPGEPFPRNLGKYESRNQTAINMSIGSMRIRDDLGLTVAWINGHHVHSCAQFAAINPADAKFATEMGRNLIVCFADLMFQPAWFDYACGPRPPLFDPHYRTNEETAKEMKADPIRGAPKFFNNKLSEVPAHFITPPPRRIRTPTPQMPKIPIIPRQVGEPKKQKKWIPADEGPQLRARGAHFRGERRRGTCRRSSRSSNGPGSDQSRRASCARSPVD